MTCMGNNQHQLYLQLLHVEYIAMHAQHSSMSYDQTIKRQLLPSITSLSLLILRTGMLKLDLVLYYPRSQALVPPLWAWERG